MLVPALPPQPAAVGGFDYVTVDAARRRVYAAHGGAGSLLIADADSGKIIGEVRVGPMHGLAVDPASGHVFTGNGADDSISEVDPVGMRVLRTTKVPGEVDALIADPMLARLYADEDNGTRIFVIDTKTMRHTATVVIPGHKPEYLAVDPRSHRVYQNIADARQIVVIDPASLAVVATIATPELESNHPLQYDDAYGIIVVGGSNGVMSAYAADGRKLAQIAVGRFDQCDLDRGAHVLACAGGGGVTQVVIGPSGALRILDVTAIDPAVHTVGIDPKTHAVFAVWGGRNGGAFVQRFEAAAEKQRE
jgi:DNA-binding beta-propeller fold protein YncE